MRAFGRFSSGIGTPAITPAQCTVLLLVEADPGIKQTTIARAIEIDRSTTLRLIERCEAEGYLERNSLATDRRAAPPRLTGSPCVSRDRRARGCSRPRPRSSAAAWIPTSCRPCAS